MTQTEERVDRLRALLDRVKQNAARRSAPPPAPISSKSAAELSPEIASAVPEEVAILELPILEPLTPEPAVTAAPAPPPPAPPADDGGFEPLLEPLAAAPVVEGPLGYIEAPEPMIVGEPTFETEALAAELEPIRDMLEPLVDDDDLLEPMEPAPSEPPPPPPMTVADEFLAALAAPPEPAADLPVSEDPELEIFEEEFLEGDDIIEIPDEDLDEPIIERIPESARRRSRPPEPISEPEPESSPLSDETSRLLDDVFGPEATRQPDGDLLTPIPESGSEPIADEDRTTLTSIEPSSPPPQPAPHSEGPTIEQLGDTINLEAPFDEETLELQAVLDADEPPDSDVLAQSEPLEAEPSAPSGHDFQPESRSGPAEVFPPLGRDSAQYPAAGRESGLQFSARRPSPAPGADPVSFTPREAVRPPTFLEALDSSLKLEL